MTAVEHFVTLFDQRYMPCGLALWHSLRRHCPSSQLWVLAMDDQTADALRRLALPGLRVVPLADVETPELLAIKAGRSRGEYCWTLTPTTFRMVFAADPSARRATYLDADISILSDPCAPLAEMHRADRQVLITPHAFAPEYEREGRLSGTYCVQFLCANNDARGLAVIDHWEAQCRAWCFAKPEPGRFGDQMYLEDWPQRHQDTVHVVDRPWRFLAPWNVHHVLEVARHTDTPVCYHFHGLRIGPNRLVQLQRGYHLGDAARSLYRAYLADLAEALAMLQRINAVPPPQIPRPTSLGWLRNLSFRLQGRLDWGRLPETT